MTPVKQTRYGREGNCLAACVASVLECRLEAVPEFGYDGWYQQLENWLMRQQMRLLRSDSEQTRLGIAIAVGNSERNLRHAVVWYDGRMLHDPHPGRTGLVGDPVYFLYVSIGSQEGLGTETCI